MKTALLKSLRFLFLTFSFALWAPVAAQAQAPVITFFSGNGVLVCSNLAPGSVAAVQWASSLSGPWQTNWAGPGAVTVRSNGTISVSVPMFYRVWGMAQTNSAPPGGMVLIPAGSFTMGDTLDGEGDAIPTNVYVSAFYMDVNLVSYSQWQSVYTWAASHGYGFDNAGSGKAANHPVQTVDWYDCVKWCNARSEMEGKTPAYYTDAAQTLVYRSGNVDLQNNWVNWTSAYRLPTEAEWEKAARGGLSGQRFPWGNTISWSQANYYGSPLSLEPSGFAYDLATAIGFDPAFSNGDFPWTSPVGSFAPNGYGLHDMAGNVWEWCWDSYDGTSYAGGTDPHGPASDSSRVFRGGSWLHIAMFCRTADRINSGPATSINGIGFRSVLPQGQP